jgi:hypothetical protein
MTEIRNGGHGPPYLAMVCGSVSETLAILKQKNKKRYQLKILSILSKKRDLIGFTG